MSGQVHWHEGMFLQPHHLQLMQRQALDADADARRLAWSYPYGLVEAQLSADALENMRVRFDRLRVVMPSGMVIDCPGNTQLPALDIKRAFESASSTFTVSLGVPLWDAHGANTVAQDEHDSWRVKRLYRVAEVEHPDENTGEDSQTVLVRQINARLLLDSDDQTDMEVLPLLRIAHATGEEVGLPRQDPSYVPPCMVLQGSTVLRDLARDLANQVEASRSELVNQITRGGFSIATMHGIEFEQMLRLRTLNRFGARLGPLAAAPGVTPFETYLEWRQLLGELSALQPGRDLFVVPAYDHDNPAPALLELEQKIRQLLRGVVTEPWWKVNFVAEENLRVATLEDQHLTAPNEYFLAIQTRQDPRQLAKLVEDADQFKFMARSLANQRIWGVKLAEERHPPLGLPAQTGLHYFRLLRGDSARMWERITGEKAVAIRWPGMDVSDFEISLYMTVPGAED